MLLLAKGKEALRVALAAWAAGSSGGSIEKTYLAVTRGVPKDLEGTVDQPILEHRSGKPELIRRALVAAYGPSRAGHLLSGRRVLSIPPIPPPGRSAVHPAGRPAQTRYRVLRSLGDRALVELSPSQGRLHQIRVHLLALGAPLLGDRHYDAMRRPGDVPLLHAWRLSWKRPGSSEWIWEAPLPEKIAALLR